MTTVTVTLQGVRARQRREQVHRCGKRQSEGECQGWTDKDSDGQRQRDIGTVLGTDSEKDGQC